MSDAILEARARLLAAAPEFKLDGHQLQVPVPVSFETAQAALWEHGDWNGDGQFTSGDFVTAFQDGGYKQGPRPVAAVVSEPTSLMAAVLVMAITICARFRRSSE